MNKKYLSVILFGALMLGTTGTFTSCKDYDDDINQINKELTDIKSAISELQSKVDNGKYVTNITKEGEGIKITWNDNSTSVIETIKGDKGADGTIVTIVDGYWAFDGVKSERCSRCRWRRWQGRCRRTRCQDQRRRLLDGMGCREGRICQD